MNLASLLDFDAAGFAVKTLAVIGGAVLGGLSMSGLARLLVRLVTSKQMPGKVRWLLRSLGGVIAGWIVALFLFGSGGGGVGGAGGWGFGGAGEGAGNATTGEPPAPDRAALDDSGHPLSSPSTELRIEVLGDEPLRKLNPQGRLDPAHCYRIDGEEPPRLHTLAEIKQLISHRLTQKPALKSITIVLYKDSPGRKVKRAADLENLLDGLVASQKSSTLSYTVDDKVPKNAPTR